MPSLLTSAFNAMKSFLAAKSDVSMPVAWSNYISWSKSNTILTFSLICLSCSG